MPFYEGIGLIAEKHAVVLDVGAALTKVGYAGEATPRAIVPTPASISRAVAVESSVERSAEEDDDALYDALVQFVHHLYFRHLLVNPKDRRVVLVDDLLRPVRLKDLLSRVLFRHFEVLSVLYAPSHLMPLFTLSGVQTGLIIDIGFSEITLVPVYEGVPILKAWQALPLGSKAIHARLRQLLSERAMVKMGQSELQKLSESASIDISERLLEDIKVRLCFVTNLDRGRQIQKLCSDASEVSGLSSFLKKMAPESRYPLGGDLVLHIDGVTRESACEVLFEQDIDQQNFPAMVLNALLRSPVDTRKDLARNIIVVGGTSMIVGLKARLFEEINLLRTSSEDFKDKLSGVSDFRLHTPPAKATFTAWTGASIFGATDAITTRSFSREAYLKEGGKAVPDWSNLRYNTLYSPMSGVEDTTTHAL